eukprot:363784-Chlamydomonas_euryale.AAC.18
MQRGASYLSCGCLEQACMLKRTPGRPLKALPLAAADVECLQACWVWLQGNSDAVPTARDGVNVLQAMQTGEKPVRPTPVHALVIAAMERHAPCMLTAHGGTFFVSTSRVHRVRASCNTACAEGSTNKPKARQKKTAKAASNEGAGMSTGRRRGSPSSSKNKPRIGHTVMQKAEVQAKAKA